jgi:hypothetical protein
MLNTRVDWDTFFHFMTQEMNFNHQKERTSTRESILFKDPDSDFIVPVGFHKTLSPSFVSNVFHQIKTFHKASEEELWQKLHKSKNVVFAQKTGQKAICSNCGCTQLKIMADYSSNGIWCAECGMMIDYEDTDLPKELVSKIEEWILTYERRYRNLHEEDHLEPVPNGFNEEGFRIASEVTKYHRCLLWMEREGIDV